MEKKTNIAELLKNAPSGRFDLYLTTEGFCSFDCVFDDVGKRNHIRLYNQGTNKSIELDPYGRVIPDGECILFPSKTIKNWAANWQSLIMPYCYGSVIIDKFGESFLVTKYYLYTVSPKEQFSIIRWHKFDYERSRFATLSETQSFFEEFYSNGYEIAEDFKVICVDEDMRKANEIGKTYARQYLPTTFDLSKKLSAGDEADFVFSNEECKNAALEMAKYKDEEFKKFLCYYFKFGNKLFEMYKNGDYKIDEINGLYL